MFVGININLFETLGLQWCPGYSDLFKVTNSNYFPIQFSPSDNPNVYITEQDDPNLDGKVVEMRYDGEKWIMSKIRNDRDVDVASGKYFGNDFQGKTTCLTLFMFIILLISIPRKLKTLRVASLITCSLTVFISFVTIITSVTLQKTEDGEILYSANKDFQFDKNDDDDFQQD